MTVATEAIAPVKVIAVSTPHRTMKINTIARESTMEWIDITGTDSITELHKALSDIEPVAKFRDPDGDYELGVYKDKHSLMAYLYSAEHNMFFDDFHCISLDDAKVVAMGIINATATWAW